MEQLNDLRFYLCMRTAMAVTLVICGRRCTVFRNHSRCMSRRQVCNQAHGFCLPLGLRLSPVCQVKFCERDCGKLPQHSRSSCA